MHKPDNLPSQALKGIRHPGNTRCACAAVLPGD